MSIANARCILPAQAPLKSLTEVFVPQLPALWLPANLHDVVWHLSKVKKAKPCHQCLLTLTRDEQAMLQKLEKREEERRKKRHMQGQQQPSMPSSAPAPLKIKLPVAPATYDASSHQSRKRGLDTSGMMEPSHKYSKRGDESAQMSKNHAQVPPTNISHRSSHHKHPSSSRSLEGGERKVQKSDY